MRAPALLLLLTAACSAGETVAPREQPPPVAAAGPRAEERTAMVLTQIERRGVKDVAVLNALRKVPRHEFVSQALQRTAYDDTALGIGLGQTISQPYIVASMTEAARVGPADRVLEIGTGSGYQAAVLAELTPHVYTIEIVKELAAQAKERLARLGYDSVQCRTGDGYAGWPEAAPFDAIVVTAAPDEPPPALLEQLAVGGRMVIPLRLEAGRQALVVFTKDADGEVARETLYAVRFVPFTRKSDFDER